jgi:hypothetical protein
MRGRTGVIPGPQPSATRSSSARRSVAERGRRSGSFSSRRRIVDSNAGDSGAPSVRGDGGVRFRISFTSAVAIGAVNGGRPVDAS